MVAARTATTIASTIKITGGGFDKRLIGVWKKRWKYE
jgi:hypothetical protein